MISKKNLLRIFIVCVLIGFNYYMGRIFLSQSNLMFSAQAAKLLAMIGIRVSTKFADIQTRLIPTPEPYSLNDEQILTLVNQERKQNQLDSLIKSEKLSSVAQKLIEVFAQQNYEIDNRDYGDEINKILKDSDYPFELVADVAVIGPLNSQAVVDHWLSQENQKQHVLNKSFTETGVATKEILIDGQKNGVAVEIFAKPCEASPLPSPVAKPSPKQTTLKPSPVPEISDDDVVRALNEYRADHKVHQLIVDQNLCRYAEKRVTDLQKKGTLDGHEGFQKDFANPDNLPDSIKAYSGGVIGENLASQFCINGTTGQSFTATSATALIEWCFDSSTKGHREAQLNERYNAVCSRHGSNMYVVIFGE